MSSCHPQNIDLNEYTAFQTKSVVLKDVIFETQRANAGFCDQNFLLGK